jgi:hypothetical protein
VPGGIALVVYGMFFASSAVGYVGIIGQFVFATAAGDLCLMGLGCRLPTEGSKTRAVLRKGPREGLPVERQHGQPAGDGRGGYPHGRRQRPERPGVRPERQLFPGAARHRTR